MGAYALAKREPGFAAAWDAALAARDGDRRAAFAKPLDALSDAALLRRLRSLQTKLDARPKGVVAQQNKRWALSHLKFGRVAGPDPRKRPEVPTVPSRFGERMRGLAVHRALSPENPTADAR